MLTPSCCLLYRRDRTEAEARIVFMKATPDLCEPLRLMRFIPRYQAGAWERDKENVHFNSPKELLDQTMAEK